MLPTRACEGGRCPGTQGGSIKSPGFPFNYPDKAEVEYELETEEFSTIELNFEVFDLELEGGSCREHDYITIDGHQNITIDGQYYNYDYDYYDIFCGEDKPPRQTSQRNTLTVKFYSDYSDTRQGFLATWRQVLPAPLVEGRTEGEFKSPNYPNDYPRRTDIIEYYSLPEADQIEFTVVDFQTEGCCDRFCIDLVTVRHTI